MRIHELDCCAMQLRLIGNPLASTDEQWIVTRCLLLERGDGLALVDTGVGVLDRERSLRRLGVPWTLSTRCDRGPNGSALEQVRALGFEPEDVRDIVLTHMDLDHAGGVADFPHATVHVSAREWHAAHARALPGMQRGRYRRHQWRGHEVWRRYEATDEAWYGIAGAMPVEGFDGDVLFVPLPGHSRGHCGVAIRRGDRWLLHAGDAFLDHRQLTERRYRLPLGLAGFELAITADHRARRASVAEVRRLWNDPSVEVTCSHDPALVIRQAPVRPA